MAPRDIPIGSKYTTVITEAIISSKAVVLIFSERSAISPWVESEINIAFSNRKPIIPYKIDKKEKAKVFTNRTSSSKYSTSPLSNLVKSWFSCMADFGESVLFQIIRLVALLAFLNFCGWIRCGGEGYLESIDIIVVNIIAVGAWLYLLIKRDTSLME